MPASRVLPLLLALAAGCGNDTKLTELEGQQRDLRTEFDATAAEIAEMRSQLQAMGVLEGEGRTASKAKGKAGGAGSSKGKGKVGHPLPKEDVTAALGFTAARTGTIPTLPALPQMQRSAESACGWKFQIKEIQPISDYQVNAAGLGKAGPVVLLQDGKPLTAHALPADYEGRCAGAFRHAGFLIMFSPEGTPEAAEGKQYTIALSDQVPLVRGDDGRPIYWIYPGTTLRIETGKAWDPAWGALDVDLVTRAFGEGSPYQVTIAGAPVELPEDNEAPHLHQTLDPAPGTPIVIEISSPADGRYVAIETLTLGNAEHAAVVTSEAAFRAAAGK